MTRPFHPIDAERVIRLQTHSTSLDVESTVLFGQAPLAAAVAGWLRWPGAATRMLLHGAAAGGAPDGFVIVRHRRGAAWADLVCLAPALTAAHGAAHTWQRLIGDAIVAVGQAGATRLLAAVEAENALALHVLQQSGFIAYGADTVLRRDAAVPLRRPPDAAAFDRLIAVPLAQGHRPALSALFPADPSPADRPAISPLARMASAPPRRRFGRERWRAVVDGRGRLHGAVRVVATSRAVWLGIAARPESDATQIVDLALDEALRLRPGVPIWTAVRDEAAALAAAADAAGFAAIARRCLLARATGPQRVASVWREPARAMPTATTTTSSIDAGPMVGGWPSTRRHPSTNGVRRTDAGPLASIRPAGRRTRAAAPALPGEGT